MRFATCLLARMTNPQFGESLSPFKPNHRHKLPDLVGGQFVITPMKQGSPGRIYLEPLFVVRALFPAEDKLLVHLIVRCFARDDHIMRVTLDQARICDAHQPGLAAQVVQHSGSGIAHT